MDNILMKNNIFSGQYKFLVSHGGSLSLGRVDHNGGKLCIDFSHVSDHLEQFGRSFIFSKKCMEKLIIYTDGGYPRGE